MDTVRKIRMITNAKERSEMQLTSPLYLTIRHAQIQSDRCGIFISMPRALMMQLSSAKSDLPQ
jgi:hypothetical protein